MPKKSKPPAVGGIDLVLPKAAQQKKLGFSTRQSRLPKGLKKLPGGGKGGKPLRFPGRAGGR